MGKTEGYEARLTISAARKSNNSQRAWIEFKLDTLMPDERDQAIAIYEGLFHRTFENFHTGGNLTEVQMWVDNRPEADKLLKALMDSGIKLNNTQQLKQDVRTAAEGVALMEGILNQR